MDQPSSVNELQKPLTDLSRMSGVQKPSHLWFHKFPFGLDLMERTVVSSRTPDVRVTMIIRITFETSSQNIGDQVVGC